MPLSSCSRLRASQLTCSQSLGSSAMASSPSVWGRWIFDSLRLTSPDEIGIPASGPFFPLTVAAVIFLIVLLKFTPTEHC